MKGGAVTDKRTEASDEVAPLDLDARSRLALRDCLPQPKLSDLGVVTILRYI